MSADHPFLTLVIPAYQEASGLPGSLEEIAVWAGDRPGRTEVIVVDDGSTDGTADVAREAARAWPDRSRLRVLRRERNGGKGAAVRQGMLTAQGDIAVFTDSDLAYGVGDIDRVTDTIAAGADMVAGVRKRHVGVLRTAAGTGFRVLVRAMGLSESPDPQCGLKGFRRDVAALLFGLSLVDGFAFDVELFTIARLHGLDVRFVPVEMRQPGTTSVSLTRDVPRMVRAVREIRHNAAEGLYEVPAPTPRAPKTVAEDR